MRGDEYNMPSFDLGFHAQQLSLQPSSLVRLRAGYGRAAHRALRALAEIVQLLRVNGILEDSLLVVTSDHGQCLGEHGYFGHGRYLYDELVRVPLIVSRSPTTTPSVTPSDSLRALVDHRHLYDLLAGVARGDASGMSQERLADSVMQRGPALSYYEGSPMSGERLLARTESYRLMRFTSLQGSLTSRVSYNRVETVAREGDSEACAAFYRLMEERGWFNGHMGPVPGKGDPVDSVSKRLAEWGYH